MSEDAEQPDAVDPADGGAQQTAEVQAAAQDMQDIVSDGIPQAVKDWVEDYVERRIAMLVANGQIQPTPSA